ncbi:bidirectional sugar transporter SWEET16-like [Amaranthus tricolor]|uniref:bidirectional sugar transporter SWEET16-like n=1 Tax=Amaranthus tricolor TaxID=29722 RepID=UPI002589C460|nr:bidirectional sugar transporter SWEET16-like [Amaranthus tricolor]
MVDLSFFVGVIGNIISLLMFLSPTSTFKRIIEHKSTEGFESVPYICTLLSSSLWTYYGFIKPEYLVSTINGFGVFVQMIFVILFLIYAPRPMKVKTWILVGILNVGFFGAAIVVPELTLKAPNQVDALGLLCAGLNVVMYGSPLTAMKTVVTTKSVEFMPFLLSFFMFLNGATWTFYAVLRWDIYLMVPNGIGCFLGAVQLVLYAIYRNAKPSKSDHLLSQSLLEEGSQQAILNSSSSHPTKQR